MGHRTVERATDFALGVDFVRCIYSLAGVQGVLDLNGFRPLPGALCSSMYECSHTGGAYFLATRGWSSAGHRVRPFLLRVPSS